MAFGLLPPAPKKYLWGWFFGVLEELWERFWGSGVLLETCLGDLGGLLWIHSYFFGHLGGSWSHFGWPWAPFGRLLGAFGEHLGAFGWPVAAFFRFVSGKCETLKSDVLLREIEVLRGGGELVGVILGYFW